MARSKLRRISFLTERDPPLGSKSGMRLSSPRVRKLECPEDCMDVLAVMASVPRAGRAGSHTTSLIRVHFLRRAGASLRSSVDAEPIRAGTLQDAPGDPLRSEALGFAASTRGPWAVSRPPDRKSPPSKRLRGSLGSRQR